MNFCAQCGNRVVFQKVDGDHLPRFVCESCSTIHYQNPRVIVGCIPIWDNKILLCRRGIEPQWGYWNIPGGFMENNETVEQGAAREAFEEAGLQLEILSLQSVFTVDVVHQVHLHFVAKITAPEWHLTPETTEIQLFEFDKLPWNEIAFASNRFALKCFLEDQSNNVQRTHLGNFTHEYNKIEKFNAIGFQNPKQ